MFSPPDKTKHLKELNEQMSSDADIKRQQAPRSLKAAEAFRILIRLKKSKSQKSEQKNPTEEESCPTCSTLQGISTWLEKRKAEREG